MTKIDFDSRWSTIENVRLEDVSNKSRLTYLPSLMIAAKIIGKSKVSIDITSDFLAEPALAFPPVTLEPATAIVDLPLPTKKRSSKKHGKYPSYIIKYTQLQLGCVLVI